MILALAGGVGGAKLAAGLARVLPPGKLTVVVNTGDDFEHLGLHISPDLDTVMYNLADRHNPETGWGLAGESWRFMEAMAELGGETWFRLGDRDLATHVLRTQRLRAGCRLSEVTASLCASMGITQTVAPMSDDPVRTVVHTVEHGRLAFQDYFVRLRCEPTVSRVEFDGAKSASASRTLSEALADEALRAVVICPSNPYLSIAPILSIPGVFEGLASSRVRRIAVSPIVGGAAIKGPAAKLMREMGGEASATAVARHYGGLIDTFVVDARDEDAVSAVSELGIGCRVMGTIMRSKADEDRLAREILAVAEA